MKVVSARLLYREILSAQDSQIDDDYLVELFRNAFHLLVGKSRPVSAELFCRLLKLMVFDREIIASEKIATLASSADMEYCKERFEKDPSDFDNLLLYSIALLVSNKQKRSLHLLGRLCRSGWEHREIAGNIRELFQGWSTE